MGEEDKIKAGDIVRISEIGYDSSWWPNGEKHIGTVCRITCIRESNMSSGLFSANFLTLDGKSTVVHYSNSIAFEKINDGTRKIPFKNTNIPKPKE